MLSINTIGWIKKDHNIRKLYGKYEIKKLVFKSLLYNVNYTFSFKLYFDNFYKKFSYNSSISKYRTSCIFHGNSRSVFRKFKLSRDLAKKFASHGFITGLKKSSF
jgi:ribosomal protein S14